MVLWQFLFTEGSWLKAALFFSIWIASLTVLLGAAYSPWRCTRWLCAILFPLFNLANDVHLRIMGEALNSMSLAAIINNVQLVDQVGVPYLHAAFMPLLAAGIMGFGIVLSPNIAPSRLPKTGVLWSVIFGLLIKRPDGEDSWYDTTQWPGYYVTSIALAKYILDRPNYQRGEVSLLEVVFPASKAYRVDHR